MRLDPVTHYKIKQIAAHEKRSLTNMIEYLVTKEIRSFEEENGEILYTDDDLYKE
jgi:hypothetical protein